MADNIHLLRDIIREQNALIKELVNPNLTSVPRLLVLFTEVEAFFFGDEVTPGLLGDPELDGVTLMLCDDNFGNLRTLPDEKMRQHPGGYGLYYHLDFHGGPVSHEWVNASHLPKMWEQLTMAYEYGIRDVWVVNVGDISLLEFPLSYFFDLAYDMERWGIHAPNTTDAYTREWVDKQFLGSFSEEDRVGIYDIIDGYTRLNHNRKPEVMNSTVYHPVHFGEAESVLLRAGRIMEEADRLKSRCPGEALPAFYELVYFPAVASANVQRMQVLATRNEFYAKQGRAEANDYANEVAACIVRDRELTDELHSIGDGKWNGMGLSEHIGFVHWNEEGCRYPLMVRIEPANKPRIIVGPSQSTQATEGGSWTGKELVVSDFLRADVEDVNIDIACGSRQSVDYEVTTTCPWIRLSHERGSVRKKDVLTLHVDRSLVSGRQSGSVVITAPSSQVRLLVEVENLDIGSLQPLTFVESDGYICIEAEHFSDKHDLEDARFVKLEGYGRTKSGMKVMPPTYGFTTAVDRPYLEYRFLAARTGDYVVHFHLAPSNPATMDRRLAFGIQVNDGEVEIQNAVSDDFVPLNRCREWAAGVLENIRHCKATVPVREGENRLRFYAGSPLIVLEKMVLHPTTTELAASYLGPTESFYKKA